MKTSILSLLVIFSCALLPKSFALETVDFVDVEKYMGKWYEIAKYPNSFQKNCEKAEAQYDLKTNGEVQVTNTCLKEGAKIKVAKARAWIVDEQTNAKLKVQFFAKWFKLPIFAGDYWIIMLGDDYEYSVVSEPKQEFLWILSRSKTIEAETLEYIKKELVLRGFDLSKLVFEKY